MFGRLTQWIDATLHPEWYHGHHKRPPFFEGWYFKMVSPDERIRYAVIPGIFLSDDPDKHHAFVQVFDGVSGHATYHTYPPELFDAAKGRFEVRIGPNRFSARAIELDIDDDLRTVRGRLEFGQGMAWPVSLTSPGVMGWFGWVPVMECYHGVLSFDHSVTGSLTVNGQTLDFMNGRGYIEKDWGKSFPAGWVWMQTNHFDEPGVSFTASIAVTPFMGSWFPGFLAGLHNDTFYSFATYTGARVEKLEVTDDHVLWVIADNAHRLEIFATRAETSLLPGPDRVEMGKRVPETLKATIEVRLTDWAERREIFSGTGRCAGLEVAGDIARLLAAV
jgi:tocopherol cyclase